MKTKQRCVSYILMLTLIANTLYAQTIVGKEQHDPEKELYAEALKFAYNTQTESWWDSGNGFICKYVSPKGCYMIRYDKQGKYVETLEQKVWSDTAALQPSFQLSQYKSQKVTSYWEVSDVNKKGYYLELKDNKNNISCIWVDAQGIFSAIPSVYKAKQ